MPTKLNREELNNLPDGQLVMVALRRSPKSKFAQDLADRVNRRISLTEAQRLALVNMVMSVNQDHAARVEEIGEAYVDYWLFTLGLGRADVIRLSQTKEPTPATVKVGRFNRIIPVVEIVEEPPARSLAELRARKRRDVR